MLALRHVCCGLALSTLALACQSPAPAVQCRDDSDCPADYLCDPVRRFCRVDPLARDDWQPDSGPRDRPAPRDVNVNDSSDQDRAVADDSAPGDSSAGVDHLSNDRAGLDGAARDRRGLELAAIADAIESSETLYADALKRDRAGGADDGAVDAGANAEAGPADAAANTDAATADGCSIDDCNPGMVCDLAAHVCVPCGPNEQWCCDGVDCGAGHVCDEFQNCSACGRTNQPCCPDLACNSGAPECCLMVWPRQCVSLCG